jgi:DNA repair protein RAD16
LDKHPELAKVWSDIEEIEPEAVVPIEQPKELTLPLLPFQKYGVGWMIRQEAEKTVSYTIAFFVCLFY